MVCLVVEIPRGWCRWGKPEVGGFYASAVDHRSDVVVLVESNPVTVVAVTDERLQLRRRHMGAVEQCQLAEYVSFLIVWRPQQQHLAPTDAAVSPVGRMREGAEEPVVQLVLEQLGVGRQSVEPEVADQRRPLEEVFVPCLVALRRLCRFVRVEEVVVSNTAWMSGGPMIGTW